MCVDEFQIIIQVEFKNKVTLYIVINLSYILQKKVKTDIFSRGKYGALTFQTVSIINEMHICSFFM